MDALTSNSIGDLYQAVTMALGFSALHAGKTMALAAYGDDRYVELFRDHIRPHDHGQFTLRLHAGSQLMERVSEIARQAREKSDFSAQASLAFACQDSVEYLLTHCLGYLAGITNETALCFAGGVALNAVYNGKIALCTPFTRVHVPFAPGDDGTALGAAIVGQFQAGEVPLVRSFSPFLGREYSAAECMDAISTLSDSSFTVTREEDISSAVAKELAMGKVVAWFQGGSEFGPRALGHRSILAWPGEGRTRDLLNHIKGREWFRPFGPSIPAEQIEGFTGVAVESPYMQFALPMRSAIADRVPAVCHVDGSARVHTVHVTASPPLVSLLTQVKDWSGLPAVLNTSLNGRVQPIVESPREALEFFASSRLHTLVTRDLLVRRA
jgi:carbamoyltransferase